MFKNIFNSAKKFFGLVVEETVVETLVEVAVEEAITVEIPIAAPVTIADKANAVLKNISAAKADAQEKTAHYTTEIDDLERKISAMQTEIATAETTLAQLKPIADLYQDGAAEFAAAKLTEAKKAAEIANIKVVTLHAEADKLEGKAAEMGDIAKKAAEIASKGKELSGLTGQLKDLIGKTQYKIGGLESLDAEIVAITTRYSHTSGIATTANAAAMKKLADTKQAIAMAEVVVNDATAAVNKTLQTANIAKAAEEAVAKANELSIKVEQEKTQVKKLTENKFSAVKAAYEASQDAAKLETAEAIAAEVVDDAKSLSEKMDEYESVICSALCADSREDAKASLINSGIFTNEEVEEILEANW